MENDIHRDRFRTNLLEFTRAAFHLLPLLTRPSILDIGCGSGVATMELARLSDGNIIGIDIDTQALDILRIKSQQAGLNKRISILEMSMLEMNFPCNIFDIIWAEGSIYVVGFERGIREWKQYLREGGFVVIHDDATNMKKKLKLIDEYGYSLHGQISVSHKEWGDRYYDPLEKHIKEVTYSQSAVSRITDEIQLFRKSRTSSFFYILQRKKTNNK